MINRRRFFWLAAGAGAGLALGPALIAASVQVKTMPILAALTLLLCVTAVARRG